MSAAAQARVLRSPFPWFGGKSRVAAQVWDRLGDVRNYVEPFAGSMAVLLRRPSEPKIETVNDLDCLLANFWRSIQSDPEAVAHYADWPVNEADLHARHLWLVRQAQAEFRERMKTDPEFYDANIAGWWVWGISQWIGSGWCAERGGDGRQSPPGDPWRKKPNVGDGGRGILITAGRTNAGRGPRGIHTVIAETVAKRPRLGAGGRGVTRQLPDLSGDSGAAGRGVHARARVGLEDWFSALSGRLKRVRVCCGDWTRILGPAPTTCIGVTGVFLDPPYAVTDRSDVYNEESRDVAHSVREWAIANADNDELRIALCGYVGEHDMPATWSEIAWKANGGFANQTKSRGRGRENAGRERIWFSPHCLNPQGRLFQ